MCVLKTGRCGSAFVKSLIWQSQPADPNNLLPCQLTIPDLGMILAAFGLEARYDTTATRPLAASGGQEA